MSVTRAGSIVIGAARFVSRMEKKTLNNFHGRETYIAGEIRYLDRKLEICDIEERFELVDANCRKAKQTVGMI